jgi:hypothetical protein
LIGRKRVARTWWWHQTNNVPTLFIN